MNTGLNVLFQPDNDRGKYMGIRDELEAIARGAKAMSAFLFQNTSIHAEELYGEIQQIASELDLSITIRNKLDLEQGAELGLAYVFVTGHSEQWRVPAYISLKKVFEFYGWSDGAEHLESLLLGYSDADAKRLLAAHSETRIDWVGKTFYLLLSNLQAAKIVDLGKRCIDPAVITDPIEVFFNRKRTPIRKDVGSPPVKDGVLARASVREPFFRELFGRQTMPNAPDIITSSLTREMASGLNSALESNLQFWVEGAWE